MLLAELVIAGGAVWMGARAYTQRWKKKKLAKLLGTEHGRPPRGARTQPHTASLVAGTTAALQMTDSNEDRRTINRNLALSMSLMGLTAVGGFGYPFLLLLSLPGLVYLNMSYVQKGCRELMQEHRVGIHVLDALVTTMMLLLGHFFTTALLSGTYYLSAKFVHRTRDKSAQSLINLFDETPRYVWVQQHEVEVQVPFEAIQVGDIVVVHAGETIPVDGIITDGIATIDQHRLTGEAQPAEKGTGDPTFATTLVLAGCITIHAEKTGADTVAMHIGEILRRTADYKSSRESQADVIAERSAPPILALGVITLPILGPHAAMAVLMSNIGYDMRIIAPLSVLNFLHVACQKSILVKDGRALETMQDVDTIVFDKTGTLTQEQPQVGAIYTCQGCTEDMVLRYAAAAEYKQTHPIARAIRQEACARHLEVSSVQEATYEVGYGLKVRLDERLIRIGSARFMAMERVLIPPHMEELQSHCDTHGYTLVYVAVDDRLSGAIELHATIRPEAKRIISDLQQRALDVYIISGDHATPTQQLAQEVGIDHYVAETLPEHKAELIRELQREGKCVCFVGDGINDAIALQQADVSISLSGASSIAMDTAQIILMDESLQRLPTVFDLAKELDANMRMNILATALPAAVSISGVYFLHFRVLMALMVDSLGWMAGLTNAMAPLLKHRKDAAGTAV